MNDSLYSGERALLRRFLNPVSVIILAGGAAALLTAMFLDFYTIHIIYNPPALKHMGTSLPIENTLNLNLHRLTDLGTLNGLGLHRPGTILPLVLLFIVALVAAFAALYTVLYFITTGQRFTSRFFDWISMLSLVIITANFLHLLVVFMKNDNIHHFRLDVGFILALTGAVAIGIGNRKRRQINQPDIHPTSICAETR